MGDFTEVADPFALFADWLGEAEASEPNDPNAMALATVDADGLPDIRMVLLKDQDEAGFVFYTNFESAKGRELLSHPQAALLFHWKTLRRQVRVRGPVEVFTDAEPDAMLTEVHRQAQDDPIVRMSMAVREGRPLELGTFGDSAVVRRDALDPERVMAADQILVGRNATRRAYNMRVRQKRDIEDPLPVAGDKLVCLRNNRKKALFNGGLWRVKARAQSKSRIITMRLAPDEDLGGRLVKVSVRADCFGGGIEDIPWEQRRPYDEFDYGYVLTVHKSQGSQWDDVVLFDESFAFPDSRARWLYTGITRAAKRLTVVV